MWVLPWWVEDILDFTRRNFFVLGVSKMSDLKNKRKKLIFEKCWNFLPFPRFRIFLSADLWVFAKKFTPVNSLETPKYSGKTHKFYVVEKSLNLVSRKLFNLFRHTNKWNFNDSPQSNFFFFFLAIT